MSMHARGCLVLARTTSGSVGRSLLALQVAGALASHDRSSQKTLLFCRRGQRQGFASTATVLRSRDPRGSDPVIGREIDKSASSSGPRLEARPDNAFFEDVMAGGPRPPVQVDSVLKYGRGFQLSTGMEVSSAVLVLNGEALLWRPNCKIDKKGVMTMDLGSLGILDVSSTKPDMLILGTGPRNEFVSKDVRDYLHRLGIQVDTMDTRNAASTFNVLAAEGRSVAAALLPA